ncbi:MAG: hypothetical protein U0270_36510 [Labilithrix sp.]
MLNGIAMVLTGLYGVFWPDAAMNVMTGHDHVWDPQTLSLMRMHNGADFGLGVGFVLTAWRPGASFAAFALCLFANVAHGVVHVADEVAGHHHAYNMGPIAILIGMSAALAALYPWRDGMARYMEQT